MSDTSWGLLYVMCGIGLMVVGAYTPSEAALQIGFVAGSLFWVGLMLVDRRPE